MPAKGDRSAYWLGKYLSLALALPASVAGGYIVGSIGDHYFHLPVLRAVGIILGMVAGMIQVVQQISRDEKRR
jgi:F0F1-type ATP synthase assembly protein I